MMGTALTFQTPQMTLQEYFDRNRKKKKTQEKNVLSHFPLKC